MRPGQHDAEGLERASYLVADIDAHAYELRPSAKHRADRMAVETFDRDLTVPASFDDLSQAVGIIFVGLVDLQIQGGFRMPGVKTNNRYANCRKRVPMPGR